MLHSRKSANYLWWGAGIEFMAGNLERTRSSPKRAQTTTSPPRCYIRSHLTQRRRKISHATASSNVCINTSCNADLGDEVRGDGSDFKDRVVPWMKRWAATHKILRLRLVFIVTDVLAYLASRTAVRTGIFNMLMTAFRRLAPIFGITGRLRTRGFHRGTSLISLQCLTAISMFSLKYSPWVLKAIGLRVWRVVLR